AVQAFHQQRFDIPAYDDDRKIDQPVRLAVRRCPASIPNLHSSRGSFILPLHLSATLTAVSDAVKEQTYVEAANHVAGAGGNRRDRRCVYRAGARSEERRVGKECGCGEGREQWGGEDVRA